MSEHSKDETKQQACQPELITADLHTKIKNIHYIKRIQTMIEINERPLRLCWKIAEWKVEHYVRTLTAYEQKHHGQLT